MPLHAVGEPAEERAGLLIGRERGGEAGGEGHLLRGVRDGTVRHVHPGIGPATGDARLHQPEVPAEWGDGKPVAPSAHAVTEVRRGS
jgi:hypothetical protein